MSKRTVVLLFMSALNLIVFTMALANDENLTLFFLMHGTSVLVFYLVNYYYLHIDHREYPLYLLICFPGIGFTLFSVIYLTVYLIPSRVKEIDQITIVEKEDDFVTFSFLDEDKVLTHLDSMNYLSQQEKLSFIFDVLDSNSINKARVLKESLMGENFDLRYYSSVYLSSMSNQLEGEVFKHKREFDMTHDYAPLKKLLEVLFVYIDSKLLEEDMLHFYNQMYIKYLLIAIHQELNVDEYQKELVKAYIRESQFSEAEEMINHMEVNYDNEMLLFELNYSMQRFKKTKEMANAILEKYKEIPVKDKGILDYWR